MVASPFTKAMIVCPFRAVPCFCTTTTSPERIPSSRMDSPFTRKGEGLATSQSCFWALRFVPSARWVQWVHRLRPHRPSGSVPLTGVAMQLQPFPGYVGSRLHTDIMDRRVGAQLFSELFLCELEQMASLTKFKWSHSDQWSHMDGKLSSLTRTE